MYIASVPSNLLMSNIPLHGRLSLMIILVKGNRIPTFPSFSATEVLVCDFVR